MASPAGAAQENGVGHVPTSALPRVRPFLESACVPTIIIPESWSEAAQLIACGTPSQSPPPVTLVCGPKNSGKSTFSRFLVNTLLRRYKSIAYLDTDVGQPEFTPSGLISLHILEEQLSDLEPFSLKSPTRSLFYGEISSKRDPKLYLNIIFQLYNYFHKMFYQVDGNENMLPLVINTPGWVKGVGYDLLVEMAKHICPSHVVQIRISSESKNLPSGAFWLELDHPSSASVIEIHAARTDCFNRTILVQKQARHLRDVRVIAYFQQCIPPNVNVQSSRELAHALSSITPYEVPLSGIKVKHLHCHVPKSEIFHSLNATIVGLAVSSEEPVGAEYSMSWCVGLGIVRGIDISRDLLYIITPVPLSCLENVDLLLQGFIEIPISILQARGFTSPYLSRNVLNKMNRDGKMPLDTMNTQCRT